MYLLVVDASETKPLDTLSICKYMYNCYQKQYQAQKLENRELIQWCIEYCKDCCSRARALAMASVGEFRLLVKQAMISL